MQDMEKINLSDRLRSELKKRIVRFTYYKKDGSLREAVGTRNPSVAREKYAQEIPAPKGDFTNENAYYDLDKHAWRSFIPQNVVSIDD